MNLKFWQQEEPDHEALAPVEWRKEYDANTLGMAYESSRELQGLLSGWLDAIDRKIIAVFAIASVIMSAIPTIAPPESGASKWLGLVAIACWLLAAYSCYCAYRPTGFRLGPDPGSFLEPEWIALDDHHFRLFRLQVMGRSFRHNRQELTVKAERLGYAIAFTAAEVLALTLYSLLRRA